MLQWLQRSLLHEVAIGVVRKLVEMLLSAVFLLGGGIILGVFLHKYWLARPYWLISIVSLLLLSLIGILSATKSISASVSSILTFGSMLSKVSYIVCTTLYSYVISATPISSNTLPSINPISWLSLTTISITKNPKIYTKLYLLSLSSSLFFST